MQCLALASVRQPMKRQVPWRCGAFAHLGVRARKPGGLDDLEYVNYNRNLRSNCSYVSYVEL